MQARPATSLMTGTRIASLGLLKVPEVSHPITPHKKQTVPEPSAELIRKLTKLNQQLSSLSGGLGDHAEVLNEKIQNIEEQILANKEIVQQLRDRISRFSYSIEEDTDDNEKSVRQSTNEISPQTVIDFLQSNPLILNSLLSGKPENAFIEITYRLTEETRDLLVEYSSKQLQRVSTCYSAFLDLIPSANDESFTYNVEKWARKVFGSDLTYLFIRDLKTGKFSTRFHGSNMEIVLLDATSIIIGAIQSQTVKYFTDPSQEELYSPSLDPLFNPENVPILLIPIGGDAILYILHTDKLSFCFTNEDVSLGEIFSLWLRPLLHTHLRSKEQQQEVVRREILSSFIDNLEKQHDMIDLIPFISKTMFSTLKARETKIFYVEEKGFFTYSINNQQLLQKKIDLIGVPNWILQNNHYVFVDKLNTITCPAFDPNIDGWSQNKSFAGFPIKDGTDEVVAIFCVSDKENSPHFNQWDLEFLQNVANSLSLVIPRCLKNEITKQEEQYINDLLELPETYMNLGPDKIDEKTALKTAAELLQKVIKSEWLSIYTLKDGKPSMLITLFNGEESNKIITSDEFIAKLFKENQFVNLIDVSYDNSYQQMKNINAKSLIASTNVNNETKYAFVAINSTTPLGHFDDVHPAIMQSIGSFLSYVSKIGELKQEIKNNNDINDSLNNVLKACGVAGKDQKPFYTLLAQICELSSLKEFAVLKFIKLKKSYEIAISSMETEATSYSMNDRLFSDIKDTSVVCIKSFGESEVVKLFTDSNVVLGFMMEESVFLFSGDNSSDETFDSLFRYVQPLLKILYQSYIIKHRKDLINVESMNKFEIHDSLTEDFNSYNFNSTSLSDVQQINYLLTMIDSLGITEALKTDLASVSNTLIQIQAKFNYLPYHNFSQAFTSFHFLYTMYQNASLSKIFKPMETAALFLAALCHDIDHKGYESAYHIQMNTSLSYSYGIHSPMERCHAATASDVLSKSPLNVSLTQEFWNLFVNGIISTDLTRSKELIHDINEISPFDQENKDHRFLLFKLLLVISDFAYYYKPFDIVKIGAEALDKETKPMKEAMQEVAGFMPENEMNFGKDFVIPLTSVLIKLLPSLSILETVAGNTTDKWMITSQKESQ